MANYAAFFDVDGTILNTKTMFSFLEFFWQQPEQYGITNGNLKFQSYLAKVKEMLKNKQNRKDINKHYYQQLKGIPVELLEEVSEAWWKNISQQKDLFITKTIKEIEKHKNNGADIVLVTGSMYPCIKYLMQKLNIKHGLHTKLETSNNQYTGIIIDKIMISDGKANAVENFVGKKNYSLDNCLAYGDHISDSHMLEIVGTPVAVNPGQELKKYALKKQWRIL
jgi:HAD superfamily hydrolase (TIGR01490 family)